MEEPRLSGVSCARLESEMLSSVYEASQVSGEHRTQTCVLWCTARAGLCPASLGP